MRLLLAFLRDEDGTAMIEYGLIASMISIVALSSMYAIGGQVQVFFDDMVTSLGR